MFLELKRRQKEIYYYHTDKGLEVDFIVRDGVKITELIQVCVSMEDEKTQAREQDALMAAMHETGLTQGFILTKSTRKTIPQEGKIIEVMPVYQWMLQL